MKQSKFSILDFNDPKKLAAVVVFVITAVAFLWEIVSAFSSNERTKATIKMQGASNKQEQLDVESPLFTTALFGDYVPANLSDADIKESMLDVQIVGIMFAAKEAESQVVLRLGGGKEENYVVGDKLPGGAVIKRISPEGVVVLHNGALESLSLPKNELIFNVPEKPLIEE